MQSPSSYNLSLTAPIQESLRRTRVTILSSMLPSTPISTDIVQETDGLLMTVILELTEFEDAIGFFGQALRSKTDKDIYFHLLDKDFIPPALLTELVNKCELHYQGRARDRRMQIASRGATNAGSLPISVPSHVSQAFRTFLVCIGPVCLLSIRDYYLSLPQTAPEELEREVPKLRKPRVPGATSPTLLTIPSITNSGEAVYSTTPRTRSPGALVSSSPSAALEIVRRRTPDIDRGSEYARQIAQSSISFGSQPSLSANGDDDEDYSTSDAPLDSFYGHGAEATSTTGLTTPSHEVQSSAGSQGGKLGTQAREGGSRSIRKVASAGVSVLRRLGAPSSSRGQRSREPSTTRSEASVVASPSGPTPPVPSVHSDPAASPLDALVSKIAAGAKPVIPTYNAPADSSKPHPKAGVPVVSIDHKGFVFPWGTGVADKSQPVVGVLRDLGVVTINKILAAPFWKNAFNHQHDCRLCFHGTPEIVLNHPSPRCPADGADLSFVPVEQPSGTVKIMLICTNEQHGDYRCTKDPFVYPFPIDLSYMHTLEVHCAERAQRMCRDVFGQLMLFLEAEAAEQNLAKARGGEEAGPSGAA